FPSHRWPIRANTSTPPSLTTSHLPPTVTGLSSGNLPAGMSEIRGIRSSNRRASRARYTLRPRPLQKALYPRVLDKAKFPQLNETFDRLAGLFSDGDDPFQSGTDTD